MPEAMRFAKMGYYVPTAECRALLWPASARQLSALPFALQNDVREAHQVADQVTICRIADLRTRVDIRYRSKHRAPLLLDVTGRCPDSALQVPDVVHLASAYC